MIQNFDFAVLQFLQNNFNSQFLDNLFLFITRLGNFSFIWIIIALILISIKKYRVIGITMLLALLFSQLIGNELLKNLIQRPRPYITYSQLETSLQAGGYSFPSGHTASSFAAVTVLLLRFKKYNIFFIILASLIAFSRLYLFVHYPTDILGGIVLGIICGLLAVVVIDLFIKKITFIYKRKK